MWKESKVSILARNPAGVINDEAGLLTYSVAPPSRRVTSHMLIFHPMVNSVQTQMELTAASTVSDSHRLPFSHGF